MTKMNDLNTIYFWLIKKLCLDTGATSAKIKIEGIKGPYNTNLGEWEITIKKVEEEPNNDFDIPPVESYEAKLTINK